MWRNVEAKVRPIKMIAVLPAAHADDNGEAAGKRYDELVLRPEGVSATCLSAGDIVDPVDTPDAERHVTATLNE